MRTVKYMIRNLILGILLSILFCSVVFAAGNPLKLTFKFDIGNGETVVTFWSNGNQISFEDIMNSKDENGLLNYSQIYINDSDGVQAFTVDLADEHRRPLNEPTVSNGFLGGELTDDSIVIPREMRGLKAGFYGDSSENTYEPEGGWRHKSRSYRGCNECGI